MEYQIDNKKDNHRNTLTQYINNPKHTLNFNINKPISKEDFDIFFGVDTSNMPNVYDIQYIKFVQTRKHKKRRINKKWLKRYGYKQMIIKSKGCKIKTDINGNVEFVK